MPVTNVGSKWVGGDLQFFNRQSGANILTIGANGLNIGAYPARRYYVNNITGDSGNSGLSWDDAFAQPSEAIAASETFRLLGFGAPTVTTNDYVRNTVMIQGTGTPYAAFTDIPNYTDLIGVGADPRGNGTGIAIIDGVGNADAMAVGSAGCRGLFMVNLQFNQSVQGNFYAADFAKLFRSRIEGCVFSNAGHGGLRIVLGGGVYIIDCTASHDSLDMAIGLTLGAGTTCNAMKIVDCEFFGNTSGTTFTADAGKGTVFKKVFACGGTYGFVDSSLAEAAAPKYIDCYGYGTNNTTINETGFRLTHTVFYTHRAFGCIDNANGTVRNYPNIDND